MTARELADRLQLSDKGVTPERIAKAKARAQQFGIKWAEVEKLINAESPAA